MSSPRPTLTALPSEVALTTRTREWLRAFAASPEGEVFVPASLEVRMGDESFSHAATNRSEAMRRAGLIDRDMSGDLGGGYRPTQVTPRHDRRPSHGRMSRGRTASR